MYDFASLPPRTLLLEYACYPKRDHLQHLARFVNQLGYRKLTRKAPTGRDITPDDIRHRLQTLLQAFPAYPTTRAPRETDYLRLRVQILEQYDEETIR
jgi:hypothetical protein